MATILKMKKPDILGKLKGSPKKHLAIDIGNHAIKILELRSTAKGIDLVHYAVAPTPPGGFQVSVLAAQLKEMLQQHSIKTKLAVASVSGEGVATRRLALTNIPRMKFKRLSAGRVRSCFPFPWLMRRWPFRSLTGKTAVRRKNTKYWLLPLPGKQFWNI